MLLLMLVFYPHSINSIPIISSFQVEKTPVLVVNHCDAELSTADSLNFSSKKHGSFAKKKVGGP